MCKPGLLLRGPNVRYRYHARRLQYTVIRVDISRYFAWKSDEDLLVKRRRQSLLQVWCCCEEARMLEGTRDEEAATPVLFSAAKQDGRGEIGGTKWLLSTAVHCQYADLVIRIGR